MKKILLMLSISVTVADISLGQIFKEKTNANPNVNTKMITVQLANKPVTAAIINKPAILQTIVKPENLVPLNSHDSRYHNYIAKSNAHIPPGLIKNLFDFSKTYVYPDGTKTQVFLFHNNASAPVKVTNGIVVHTGAQTNTGDDANDCTTTNVSLSATSDNFMNNNYSSQASFIYPGAIYSDDNLFSGNFKEESNGRYPIIITTNNTNISGNNYEIVQQPNEVNITNAITKLFQRFSTVNAANESTSMQIYEANNSADLNMKLGVDASGYGVSFDGYINHQKDERTEYLTIDCIKNLFSISVALPDSGYYKTNPADSHLTVIGTVNYGVRVLANLRITFQSEQDEAGFNGGYTGFGVQSNVDFNFLSSNSSTQSTINAYYVGGPSSYTTTSFDKTQLQNQITQYLTQANYQNAVPISYELYDLNNNIMNNRSATDQFQVPLCVPKAMDNASLDCSGNSNDANATYAVIQTGNNSGDNKDPDTHYSFGIFDNNSRPIASFHDDSNNDPYNEGTTSPSLYLNSQNSAAFKDFVGGAGGRVHINIAPNGHDTWNIGSFSLFLKFTNPTSTQKLTWTGINLSEGQRDIDLNFMYDKNSNTLQAVPND